MVRLWILSNEPFGVGFLDSWVGVWCEYIHENMGNSGKFFKGNESLLKKYFRLEVIGSLWVKYL